MPHSFSSNKHFEIRTYSPVDKGALMALLRLNTPDHFAPEEEGDLEHYLEHEIETYFVAFAEEAIVGCGGINYFEHEKLARLSWDIVHPKWQGKRVGKQLVTHRLKILQQNETIDQVVVRTSQLAYRFYEKMGFTLEKVQEHFWAPDLHLYLMSIDLTRSSKKSI